MGKACHFDRLKSGDNDRGLAFAEPLASVCCRNIYKVRTQGREAINVRTRIRLTARVDLQRQPFSAVTRNTTGWRPATFISDTSSPPLRCTFYLAALYPGRSIALTRSPSATRIAVAAVSSSSVVSETCVPSNALSSGIILTYRSVISPPAWMQT